MKEENIYAYEEMGDYLKELVANMEKFIPELYYQINRPVWYDTYLDLINKDSKYDISKKRLPLPEICLGDCDVDKCKEEMKKRYLFLANNSLFLLAPLIRVKSNNQIIIQDRGQEFDKNRNLYTIDDIYLAVLLEKLLLSEETLEENELYQKVNKLKDDTQYLKWVKEGLYLMQIGSIDEKLDDINYRMFDLLKRIRGLVEGQPEGVNKQRKLCVLDEYFRILRYSNDGREWTSGYYIDEVDGQDKKYETAVFPFNDVKRANVSFVNGRGVGFNNFIRAFDVKKDWAKKKYTSTVHFSEKEKQDIYLKLHDELPWDLEIECKIEEPELNAMNDTRLIRPDNTKPCGASFRIKEGNIFVSRRGFYHLCNECGYIVKVPPHLISDGIGTRIKERCSKDQNLFRKMELISELQAYKVLFK